jgi:hypothetical protein
MATLRELIHIVQMRQIYIHSLCVTHYSNTVRTSYYFDSYYKTSEGIKFGYDSTLLIRSGGIRLRIQTRVIILDLS